MPVKGQEIASLDFANLIGGPLNAIVEAQAKSAITTANFIREVGFKKDTNEVINVDFKYNRKNDDGKDQQFVLTVPFLTMLPVPYITVSYAEVEFNAKITSTTESTTEDNFSQVVDASAGGNWWFASARLQSKTAYQKKSSTSDREERTFDMRVRVEARNADMPTGTERILTLLENVIQERALPVGGVSVTAASASAGAAVPLSPEDLAKVAVNDTLKHVKTGNSYTVKSKDANAVTLDRTVTPGAVKDDVFTKEVAGAQPQAAVTVTATGGSNGTAVPLSNADLAKVNQGDRFKHGAGKVYTVASKDANNVTFTETVDPAAVQNDVFTKQP